MDKTPKIILALFLCCLAFSTVSYLPVADAIIPLLIGLAVAFGVGALCGYLADCYWGQTTYELGANQTDYITNIGNEFKDGLRSTDEAATNLDTLAAGVRYLWFRRAEYTAQQYINESSYPSTKVAEMSGINAEYMNMTSSTALSDVTLVNQQVMFLTNILTGFENLDVKLDGSTDISIKGDDKINFVLEFLQTNTLTTNITIGDFKFSPEIEALLIDTQKSILLQTTKEGTGYYSDLYIDSYDTDGYCIDSILLHAPGLSTTYNMYTYFSDFIEWDADLTYKLIWHSNYNAYERDKRAELPAFLIPITTPTDLAYQIKYLDNVNASSQLHTLTYYGFDFYGENSVSVAYAPIYGTGITAFDSMDAMLATYSQARTDALSSGQTYWAYLRGLGYTDVADVPPEYLVPPPSVAIPDISSLEGLTYEQIQALYYAWLNSLETFFTSSTYQDANMTATNTTIGDLSLTVKLNLYNSAGDTKLLSEKLCFLTPTTSNIDLTIGENTTLTQTVHCVFDNGTGESTQSSWVAYSLASGYIIEPLEIWRDGVATNDTTCTLTTDSLYIVAHEYDFDIEGDPTYYSTLSNPLSLLLIVVVLVGVVYVAKDFGGSRHGYGRGRRFR